VRGSDSSLEQPYALADLIEQVRALTARMTAHDTHSQKHLGDMQASLDTALQALELIHDDDPGTRRRLRQVREDPRYDDSFLTDNPLVSVIIPTWDRVGTLIERAIPSALGQTHQNIEVIVVGDASLPNIGEAIRELDDPRVIYHNLTVRGPYPEDRYRSWLASGTPGINAGVAMARGLWIAPLGDDDAFVPEHVERLLDRARSHRLEFVYGSIRPRLPTDSENLLGEFPPRCGQIGLQAAIYHAGLRFMELELGHAIFEKSNDWGLVHRMMRVGVRMGMIDEVTVDYWPSMRNYPQAGDQETPPQEIEVSAERTAELEARVSHLHAFNAELERELGEQRDRCMNLEGHIAELAHRLEEVRVSRSWRLTAPLRRMRARSHSR
jgi:uncharacterized coiled-coil protein SlyX